MKLQDNSSYKNFQGKEVISMGLDLDNTSSIMTLLRNNIYSDPIESIVREYFSNAIDAHLRINSSESIELDIKHEDNKYFLSIRDFGSSMTKEVIENVYAKMGKSDKRTSNNQHGAWGLGAKCALSYTDHFYIETSTIENNINIYRKWVQYIDTTKIGLISLLEEEINPSTFKQGTKITIGFEQKDYSKLLSSLSLYLTYTKSNYTFLNQEVFNQLKLGTINYNYYGTNWAKRFLGYSYGNIEDKYLIIIEGIPYKLDMKILCEFISNSKGSLDYIINKNKPFYIKESQNKIRFHLYVDSLKAFAFELKIDIGTVDLSASRESLQYTDKTCRHLYAELYKMFVEFYKYISLDIVDNPDLFKAARTFYTYPGVFTNYFAKELYWNKHKIYFNINQLMFNSSPEEEFKTYKLKSVYSTKYNKQVDVIKNTDSEKIYISENNYVICIQDSKYTNYSKYIKHYINNNINSKDQYKTIFICVSENDSRKLKSWLLDACLVLKMTNLINTYNKDCPAVKVERISTKLFKSLLLGTNLERPRATGIFQYGKEATVYKEPEDKCFYLDINQLETLPIQFDVEVKWYEFINNLFKYFKSKDLQGDIYITDKVTRNYSHKNWVNLFDIFIEDLNHFNINREDFWNDEVKNLAVSNFKYLYITEHLPILNRFFKRDVKKEGYYSNIQNAVLISKAYLDNNKTFTYLVNLFNIEVYIMGRQLHRKHLNEFDSFDVPKQIQKECREFYDFCKDYFDLLPFLKTYNLVGRAYYDLDITNENYLNYINVMEKELNLYIENKTEVGLKTKTSEFSLLCNKLLSLNS